MNIEDKKVDLINDLMILEHQASLLWEYHPHNMDGKNLIADYERYLEMISNIKEEIKILEILQS
jgi:hypothetical protein